MYRSTIVIYSEFDPSKVELSTLAREAEEGVAYCAEQETTIVAAESLPESAASFFNID